MLRIFVFMLALLFSAPSLAFSCSGDLDCSIGSKCVKPRGSMYGYCMGGMNPGNQHDNQPARNPLDMTGRQGNTCSGDLDCGIGGRCAKGRGSMYGTCL